jgi:GDP-4-dehydro-6-deoxy-D-mannose reductase
VRVLITGGHGFIGRWLAQDLASQGHQVWVTYNNVPPLRELWRDGPIVSVGLDVRDAEAVEACMRTVAPERVYHLAAQSFPTLSWERPAYTMDVNVNGTVNVFEGLRAAGLKGARVLVACSSAEYGFVQPEEVPTTEEQPLRPLHPYGVSKVAQDLLAYQEHRNYGTHTTRVRIFNTTGPGKTGDVCADLTKRAVQAERGELQLMKVGNLGARRGFCDVRDMMRALQAAVEKGAPGEVYNAGATEAVSIREALDLILAQVKTKPRVEVDKALLRPTDEPIILGDSGKLRAATGWKPQIPLKQTLEDMVQHWRRALAGTRPC